MRHLIQFHTFWSKVNTLGLTIYSIKISYDNFLCVSLSFYKFYHGFRLLYLFLQEVCNNYWINWIYSLNFVMNAIKLSLLHTYYCLFMNRKENLSRNRSSFLTVTDVRSYGCQVIEHNILLSVRVIIQMDITWVCIEREPLCHITKRKKCYYSIMKW